MKTDKIVEICKAALLKQLHKVKYIKNGYPIEAVPKATVLSLDKLVEPEITQLYSAGEEVYDEVKIARLADQYAEKHSDDPPHQVDLFDGYTAGFKACLKLTRPTVSEEEIKRESQFYYSLFLKHCWLASKRHDSHDFSGISVMDIDGFKAAIKELLNR